MVWKTWAPQSRAANTIVRMCRCRIARNECRELARQKRENDAKIRAASAPKNLDSEDVVGTVQADLALGIEI